jgi:hypothetical protein
MQEIKKRRIVIASVLKPVDDPRMMDKIGMSLATDHEVHIVGSEGSGSPQPIGIQTHSLGAFPRLGLSRFWKRWSAFRICLALNADILIVCTHELLWQAVLLRMFSKTRIWYDVQENYYLNIRYLPTYPPWSRPVLSTLVRIKERVTSAFFERFLLAERCYADELSFVSNQFVIMENKARRPSEIMTGPVKPAGKRLLFTGTLSASTGVYVAIDLAVALHSVDESVTLTICGYCPSETERNKIVDRARQYAFVSLVGGETFVAHSTILGMMRTHDFGIISYPHSVATAARMPTKLYEYMASKLPILVTSNPLWSRVISENNAGLVFDEDNLQLFDMLNKMTDTTFYNTDNQHIYWDNYNPLLRSLIYRSNK